MQSFNTPMDSPQAKDLEFFLPSTEKNTQVIRLMLVDDQRFVLELLRSYFKTERDLEVVGIADNGQTALELATTLQPDIILVDIEMPKMDGLMLCQAMTQQIRKAKVIVLSNHDDEAYIRKALAAGAQGYLLKNTPSEELIHAIRFVSLGYLQLGPGLFNKLEGNILQTDQHNDLIQVNSLTKGTSYPPIDQVILSSQNTASALALDDWSSITQENLESLPQVWTRGLLYFLGFFALIVLPWALFFKVDETSVAKGRLEPKGATIRIDAKSSGTVVAVRAQEGQFVQKGQVLLELESDILRTDLQQTQAKLNGQINRLAQNELIKNQVISSLAIQAQQNQSQRFEKQAQVAQAKQSLDSTEISAPLQESERLAEVQKAEANLGAASRALTVANDIHKSNLAELQRYQKLWKAGAIPEVQVVEVKQKVNESSNALIRSEGAVQDAEKLLQGQRKAYEKLIQQLQAEQTQSKLRLQEQQGSQQSIEQGGELTLSKSKQQLDDLEAQITTLKSEIKQTQKQIQSLMLQLEQRVVRSPENGIIFQLPIKKAQSYVQPGQVLAQIAPKGLPLILKAQVSSQQSGLMKVGMPVKLKFDAYPFQDYGVVPGRLEWISPDSKTVDLGQGQGQAEVFELDVTLDKTYIENIDKRVPLTPGQSATAETIIRQRRLIDFILDPFRQLQKSGLKL